MENNVYAVADNTFMQNNVYNIDLVGRNEILLERYDNRVHHCSARPVRAYFLRAVLNEVSELGVNRGADFLFTPMLTGCMFAVYGENDADVTAVHVNALDGNSRIRDKIDEIRREYAGRFYRILCSRNAVGDISDDFVQTYNLENAQNAEQTLVFGMRSNDRWHFYRKLAEVGSPLVEM